MDNSEKMGGRSNYSASTPEQKGETGKHAEKNLSGQIFSNENKHFRQ